jgi:hypothetical protein
MSFISLSGFKKGLLFGAIPMVAFLVYHPIANSTEETMAQPPPKSQKDSPMYYVLGTKLNVRAAPSAKAERAGQVRIGENVSGTGEVDGDWTQILTSGGARGWVMTKFLGAERPDPKKMMLRAKDKLLSGKERLNSILRVLTMEPSRQNELTGLTLENFWDSHFEKVGKATKPYKGTKKVACGLPDTPNCVLMALKRALPKRYQTGDFAITYQHRGESFVGYSMNDDNSKMMVLRGSSRNKTATITKRFETSPADALVDILVNAAPNDKNTKQLLRAKYRGVTEGDRGEYIDVDFKGKEYSFVLDYSESQAYQAMNEQAPPQQEPTEGNPVTIAILYHEQDLVGCNGGDLGELTDEEGDKLSATCNLTTPVAEILPVDF